MLFPISVTYSAIVFTIISFRLKVHGLTGNGPLCLSCNKVVQPRDCSRVTRCGEHEKCYVERQVTDSGLTWFTVGCKNIQACNSVRRSDVTSDDVSDDIISCMTCCNDGDLCNRKGCGTTDRPASEGTLCYNCQQQTGPDLCDEITLCTQDNLCFIKSFNMGNDVLFSTGCRSKLLCGTNSTGCCSAELCNNKLSHNGIHQTFPTTTAHPLTHAPIQSIPTITAHSTTHAPIQSTVSAYSCPTHWMYFEESQYCFLENESSMTLTDARKTCRQHGLHLPIIETLKEQDFLKRIFEPKRLTIWLDGTDEGVEGRWVWFTTNEPITYFNWSPGQPDHYFGGHSENCMEYGSEYGFQWNDAPCHNNSRRHKVLCEAGTQRKVPACPTGWISKDHYMYCVMDFNDSWYEADKVCNSMSAHLPVADTVEAFKRIGDVAGRQNDIWLDGSEENHLNDWRWTSTGTAFSFTSWSPDEPNHFNDNEHCVEVVQRTNWNWNDAPCDAKGRVNKLVCERYKVTSEVIVG